MLYSKIRTIEFELNTICNSWCPICIRYVARDDGLYLNPDMKINQKIDIALVEKIISSELIANNVGIDMIGTAGEPVAHPDFIDIIKLILKYKPDATFNIHTNGGIRNEKFFTELAHLLPRGRSRICFSLDGLEDTNHIYRIGVDWSRAMRNLKAFIAAGGNAVWQFVIFDWNEHQLEECKKLSYELGCGAFETRTNVDPDGIIVALESARKGIFNEPGKKIIKDHTQIFIPEYDYIDDMCFTKEGIFVNPAGKIYPCCMMSADETDMMGGPHVYDAMYKKYTNDWNDINKHTLNEIMDHAYWDDLDSEIKENKPCVICARQCGATNDSQGMGHIIETKYVNNN
jgi:MoaA/NifB/PqqE/SkfB family radical SAM enzyme